VSGLAVERVSAGYGSVRILEDISLAVGADEVLAVLGPNGSGKSTLLKTVMGLTTLYDGRIAWEGRDLTALPTHRRAAAGLGYVPQTENVFPALSVMENLAMGGYLAPRGAVREELERVLALFPFIRERREVSAGSLSGGERRMLCMASTLMMRPSCLLLDEPTSDLAPAAIEVVLDKVRAIRREYRLPILLVEQNVRRALELAERVCVQIRGQKRLERPTAGVTEAELGEVFLQT
jgi:ABC-type branched-subunit amino acid transport system ATPase component